MQSTSLSRSLDQDDLVAHKDGLIARRANGERPSRDMIAK
jgi:hypothetical protein